MKKYMTIQGITKDGVKFRPSSWTDMLLTSDAKGCYITICDGIKCIDVDLESLEAERVLQFANENNLIITDSKDNR